MHQPYTAPTLNSTRPATGLHTSPRQSSIHKPIHQRHSPPNLHVHTTHKPIHQRPQTHKPNHRYHTPQIPQPYSLHKHTQPHKHTTTHTHSTQARPPTQTLTPSHREAMPYPDVDAAPMQSQPRCSRSPDALAATHRSAIGQARYQTVHNLTGRYQTEHVQDQAKPNQTGSGQAIDHIFDETSRPVSANFSARLCHKSIRVSVDAVVGVV